MEAQEYLPAPPSQKAICVWDESKKPACLSADARNEGDKPLSTAYPILSAEKQADFLLPDFTHTAFSEGEPLIDTQRFPLASGETS